MDGKLALTPQQQKLMDEWKDLSKRMDEAGIMFAIDDEFNNIYALNGNNIEETADEFDGIFDDDDENGFVGFDDDEDAQFMFFPNMTQFNSASNKLYIKYK